MPIQPVHNPVQAIRLADDGLVLLDQTALPQAVRYVTLQTPHEVAQAIRDMLVRGAPAIGIAAAFGVVLSARCLSQGLDLAVAIEHIRQDMEHLRQARPTAVNLMWALDRMAETLDALSDPEALLPSLTAAANALYEQDLAVNYAIGRHGAGLLPTGARVLTHCNAGALATVGHGTALGVVRSAFAHDSTLRVYADETRPRQQGAKLTVWELQQDGIPVTLLTDGMSGSLMRAGQVDAVIVGADRIASNGDTANKIGTYNLAIVARHHHLPFYVAAPHSTIDTSLADGSGIPIEHRASEEILKCGDAWIARPDTPVYNPGFDVTPAELITAIITETGVYKPPFAFHRP